MARKSSILDDLATLPWWLNLILAVVAYFTLKYGVPTVEFKSPIFQGIASALPNMAGMFAAIFCMVAATSAFHSWRKGELLESQTSIKSIQSLSWKEFEYLISEAYKRKGFSVSENMAAGPDGGIDLVLFKEGEKTLIQCKNWKASNIGVSVIRELFGVVTAEGASKGIIVCSGNYTKDAIDFAKKTDIELVTGTALARMIAGVQKKQLCSEISNINSSCPVCGSHMVHRVAKKGKYAGESFLGCSRYPKCRGTRKY